MTEDPEIFHLFLEFIYSDRIDSKHEPIILTSYSSPSNP
jgi:hypothetical protein